MPASDNNDKMSFSNVDPSPLHVPTSPLLFSGKQPASMKKGPDYELKRPSELDRPSLLPTNASSSSSSSASSGKPPTNNLVRSLFCHVPGRVFGIVLVTVALYTGVTMAVLTAKGLTTGSHIPCDAPVTPTVEKTTLFCDVAILGGGIAGLYAAYKLNTPSTCVFEAHSYWGGRIKDETFKVDGQTRYVGVGGLRVDNAHHAIKYLAYDLGIELNWLPYMSQRCNTRGVWVENGDDTIGAYPTFNQSETLDHMYDYFLSHSDDRHYATTMESHLEDLFEPEGRQFMVSNTRFRSDFTATDIRSYVQFLKLDIAESSDIEGYPFDGMSAFARNMLNAARASGVRFSSGDSVLKLDDRTESVLKDQRYVVETDRHLVYAKKVVVAMDPSGIRLLKGTLADRLNDLDPVKQAMAMPVSVVAQRFDKPWWNNAFNKTNTTKYPSDVRRVWTTDKCINYVEVAMNDEGRPGGDNLHTARTVYADGYCNQYWDSLHSGDASLTLMNKDIKHSLMYTFQLKNYDDLALYLDEERQNNTFYQWWPNAWHFQHPNATLDIYQIEEWAKRPLGIDEDVVMANEAWSPYRTWIRGSVHSAIYAVNEISDLDIQIETNSPDSWPARGDTDKPIPPIDPKPTRKLTEKAEHPPMHKISSYLKRGGRH